MMESYDLRGQALVSTEGEYIFGLADTGSHACYMIYGVLKSGEKQRLIKPGKGHEEMVLAVKGDLHVTGVFEAFLREGFAFHIREEDSVFLENKGADEAIYVIAGGHTEHGHHH
jgi:hypothetical protein